MKKTYFNDAIIGNSQMLGCITGKGELVRLFWPDIDYPQHIEKLLSGIFFTARQNSTIWLNEECFNHSQHYVKDTNIVETISESSQIGLRVVQADFVLPEKNILTRYYEIENTGEHTIELGFIVYSSSITTTPDLASSLFDFGCDALVHYRHGYYLSISADKKVYQFQLGNNALESARQTWLNGYDCIGMMNDGALSWKLGCFEPGERRMIKLSICTSRTIKGLKELIHNVESTVTGDDYKTTEKFWKNFLENARQVNTGRSDIDNLYRRSLLVFKLMSDEETGGLLASPEIDEGFTKSGRYAYCWGRDAAFITSALDKCGLTGVVDKFYEWAARTQDDDGSWQQRYHMDGNLAPSWGIQIDETGTIVWGMLEHYKTTGDKKFLIKMWECIKRAVEFLIDFIDEETGLPRPSYDLWEERVGEHTYSSAAVYGGIVAGIETAGIIGAQCNNLNSWKAAARSIKDAIVRNLWKEDQNCFLRSIRTKLNPWGEEYTSNKTVIKVNPKGYCRDVTLEDGMVDISLLGVAIPFGVFDVNDCRVEKTVETIERVLTSHGSIGGIKRYENDNYIGGNPWVLTTLWVALFHISKKDYCKAKDYFEWAVRSRTVLGLLPEQVNRDNGEPAWVIPLTWSHAMFILVLFGLIEGKAI